MYAKGMTTNDISAHIMDIYGLEVSDSTVSRVTDKILPVVREWQERPLENVYAVVLLDAIHYHVRYEGRIVKMTTEEKMTTVVYGVLFYSVAAGIVEEMVFRGIIMGLIEKSISVTSAVAAPSVLFGLMHIIGNHLNFLSIIQLVIGGTAVGIMFSLIELYSENFWNNALVHALWNMSTVGLMHIGTQPYSESVFTYVLKSRSILVTGGDFGIETSVISIIAYLLVIAVTLVLLSRKEKTNNIEVV